MKLIKSEKFDPNHSAMVVRINEFIPHKNADKLKCCRIGAYNIITSIDAEPGLYVYFQKESKINGNFLSYANLFRHSELNSDPSISGMFEDTGRIKTIKLRGELSEGFIIPATVFENFLVSVTNKSYVLNEGEEFDSVEDKGKTFWIIKKYTVTQTPGGGKKERKAKSSHIPEYIVDGQFYFHYSTTVIKKCPGVIHPEDKINISEKIHGTSFISSQILCKKQPVTVIGKIRYKLANLVPWLIKHKLEYRNVYSSRRVIQNCDNSTTKNSFYLSNVYYYANELVKPYLGDGITVYGEIVGYCPDGTPIQKGYDYGCVPPTNGEYIPEKHYKVRIYRVTYVDKLGVISELTPSQVRDWCRLNNLWSVDTWYEGYANELYPDLPSENWSENFIDRLSDDKRFFMEELSPSCNNKVPHEGVVIKIFGRNSEAFKLKCFRFLDKEQKDQDKGISNIEDEA